MLKGKFAVTFAVVLGAFSFGFLGSTANAITPVGTGLAITEPSNIQLAYVKKKVVIKKNGNKKVVTTRKYGNKKVVTTRKNGNKKVVVTKKYGKNRAWVYSSRYGHRYRARRAGYGYYYGGWWYARPYWQPGINLCIGC